MARITIEDSIRRIKNKFILSNIVAERALQLIKGIKSTIDNRSNNKEIVLALREVAEGKVYKLSPSESKKSE